MKRCGMVRLPQLSRAGARFVRIIMREADDFCWKPLLLAIELADFNLGIKGRMIDINARHRDIFLEQGRAHAAGHDADLRATDMDAIPMANRIIGIDIKAYEFVTRVLLALDQCSPADKIVCL